MDSSIRRLSWLATLLFFASGLSSLIYQVLWMHILVLVFGGTTLATSTVLAVFMGGLALGSFLAARWADRIANPFLWYGWLEGAIGVWALLAPSMFALATPLYQFAYQHTSSLVALNLLRFGVASLILLPPTTCMGATLPLLARMVSDRLDSLGNRIGLLYSVNTIGAVAGTGLAGFILMPEFGIAVTMGVAVAVNIALALTVIYADKHFRAPDAGQTTAAPPIAPVETAIAKLPRHVVVIIVLFAMAGAVSMIYEVAWTRALLLVIGSSTYAFSIMLAAFLLGIVAGSYACSRVVDRLPSAVACLAMLELLAGFTALIGLSLFGFFPYWNLRLGADWFHHPAACMAIRFVLSGVVLMPLTFCIGATFPAVVKSCTTQLEQVGRSVGSVYSANTLGAILGACAAGFFLVPALGAEKTLVVAALANISIGVALLFLVPTVRLSVRVLAAAVAVLLMFNFGQFPPFWDKLVLLLSQTQRRKLLVGGTFRYRSFAEFADSLREAYKLIYYRDGTSSNVAVLQGKHSGTIYLLTNGHFDASSGVDMGVQELLSYLPMWCRSGVKQVAVVGWGSGISVGAVTQFPIQHIDAIELEPAVIDAARYFDWLNHSPENDPRVTIVPNDGRNFLLGVDKKYDLIVSEPSNPWQAGVCNLFTREYFAICKQRLNQDGILSLWLQIAEVSPASIKQIASALTAEFPYTLTAQVDSGNLVIMASREPLRLDCRKLQQSLQNSSIASDLRRAEANRAEDIISKVIFGDGELRTLCENVPANTDNRNRVEYEVAKTYENRYYLDDNNKMLRERIGDADKAVIWPPLLPIDLANFKARVAASAVASQNKYGAACWLASAFRDAATSDCYRVRGALESMQGNNSAAENDWRTALQLDPKNTDVWRARGQQNIREDNWQGAREAYARALELEPKDWPTRAALARLYGPSYLGAASLRASGSPEKVLSVLGSLPEDRDFIRQFPTMLLLAADANFRLRHYAQARTLCSQYLAIVPHAYPAAHLMGLIESQLGNSKEASEWEGRAIADAHQPGGIPRMTAQAKEMIAHNRMSKAQELLVVIREYDPNNAEVAAMLKSAGK